MTTSQRTLGTRLSKSTGRSGAKKLLTLLATGTIVAMALLPVAVSEANAANYYPGYTCHYRDISGSCMNYKTQRPYFFSTNAVQRNLYGNRKTYPFSTMFNARSTTQSPWDNRYSNSHRWYRYEDDDDDNDYIDEDDEYYRYYYGYDNDRLDGTWQWYFDEDDDTYRRYRYQSDNTYRDTIHYGYRRNKDSHYEYEHTRYFCTGRDCSSTIIRY